MNRRPALLSVPAAVALLAACGGPAADPVAGGHPAGDVGGDAPLEVVVALYPYEFVVERVGGGAVEVRNLTASGAEPHDLELGPQQVAAVGAADLVVWSRGFQPALDAAVDAQAAGRGLDVLGVVEVRRYDQEEPDDHGHDDEPGEAHDHEGEDPHVWLDPTRLATIAGAVADRLAELAPAEAAGFQDRAAALGRDLEKLDHEYRAGLSGCVRDDVVTSHDAFGYLTDRYGLEQVAVAGLSPEAEPSPRRLAEVARVARERGVTTVFFEELASPRLAEQLAREVGARTDVLSPLEGAPETGDYLTAMRDNLDRLRVGLGCP